MDRLGIVLFSYNRPHYLSKALDSLFNNHGVELDDIHFYQDKFEQAPELSEQCIHLAQSKGIKNITYWHENVGIAHSQYHAYNKMFDRYEQVLFLEDDLVVSQNYVQMIKKMLKQFMPDKSVFFVNGGYRDLQGKPNEVNTGKPHQWGHAFDRQRWLDIRKFYDPLYDKWFKDRSYRRRNVLAMKEVLGEGYAAGQDATKEWCAKQAGYTHSIQTALPRAWYIGIHGEHSNPEHYNKYFGTNYNIDHKWDKTNKPFNPNPINI